MKSRNSNLLIPVIAVLAIFGAIATYQLTRANGLSSSAIPMGADDSAQMISKPAPDFTLQGVDGAVYHLSDYRGKVVMLNFWATWCPPCRKEIPEFAGFQKDFGAQGIQFLGIAMDDEGAAKVKPWLTTHPVSYPILLPDPKVTASYGEMSSIPVTFVIDRKGIIRASFTGWRSDTVVEAMFKPLLAEAPPAGVK